MPPVTPRGRRTMARHGVYHGMRAAAAAAVRLVIAAALVATPSYPLLGQSGGTLTGVVRDSAMLPIAGADVWVVPGGRRTRTDSTGRYTLGDLENGAYSVTARKLGYSPEVWDARLSANGRLELNFTLRRRTDLDTVRIVGRKGCDGLGVMGFECRRIAATASATFMDYPEIDFRNRLFVADLFRDVEGFRVMHRRANTGGVVPYVTTPTRCLASYVDGRPANITNPIPERTQDLVALEIYPRADSMPLADRRALRTVGTPLAHTGGRCAVVLYWTQNAPVDPPSSRIVGQ